MVVADFHLDSLCYYSEALVGQQRIWSIGFDLVVVPCLRHSNSRQLENSFLLEDHGPLTEMQT